MTELRPVTRADVDALIKLEVAKDQRSFVAPNAVTLAEAAHETGSRVWGLWDGADAVGLLAMIHPHEHDWSASPGEAGADRDAAYIWRLMVAADRQRAGHGSRAVEAALRQASDWGLPRIAVDCIDCPGGAIPFYERFGFRRTGRIDNGEVELMRAVDPPDT